MSQVSPKWLWIGTLVFIVLVTAGAGLLVRKQTTQAPQAQPVMIAVIVQGRPGSNLTEIVKLHGGEVTRDLGIIHSIAARIPANQMAALQQAPGVVRVWKDNQVQPSDPAEPAGAQPAQKPEAVLPNE